MSLLMDALRKAEQQKQQLAEQARPVGVDSLAKNLELEPLPRHQELAKHATTDWPASPPTTAPVEPDKIGGGPLPELPLRLEDLDEQFIAHAAAAKSVPAAPPKKTAPSSPPPGKPAPAATTDTAGPSSAQQQDASRQPTGSSGPTHESASVAASREAARKLFEAKQASAGSNRNFAIAVGLATLMAVVGIGAYFWWQLQPKGGLGVGSPVQAPAATVPAAPSAPATSPTAPLEPSPTQASIQAPQTAPEAVAPPAPAFAPPSPPPARNTEPATNGKPVPASDNEAMENAAPSRRHGTVSTSAPLNVTTKPQQIDTLAQQAYDAFNNGELATARDDWQKLLRTDPNNANALHGLAAIAQQHRQGDRAADYYLRALEADPKDALALSGLISLKGQADPQQTESRLKTLLAEQPDSPFLNFALGNLYAGNARWAEAQQAYFKAHATDPGNPDYLFNLAISLDRLRQSHLAAQYYNRAVTAAAQRPAGFDPAQATTRLKALQALQP